MRVTALRLVACMLTAASLAACVGGGGPAAATSTPEARRIQEIAGKQWTQVKTVSPLEVLSSKLFFTGLGETAYLIGELANTGSGPVTGVKITFKGYGEGGKLLDTREGEAPAAVVLAGGKAPFKIAVDMREVIRYEVIVESVAAETVPENGLVIVKDEMGEPKTGYV